MSAKYPVTWYSESKKAHLQIETMATPHIIHAWRKVREDAGAFEDGPKLRECLEDELKERGCIYDGETGRWTIPPKEPVS